MVNEPFQRVDGDVTINPMNKGNKTGKLYIVATPIGHPKDITLRALSVLKEVDAIICEEVRQGSRLLRSLDIEKTLIPLNEHNEKEEAPKIAQSIAAGETMAIISDAGTPIFADPGQHLLKHLYELKTPISPIPGPASLIAALSLCDFSIDRFFFAGFPPRKTLERKSFIENLRSYSFPVILMDTPYRLTRLLTEVQEAFGENLDILLTCDLTLQKESVYRGAIGGILPKVTGQKREFVLILNLNRSKGEIRT